MKYIYIDESGDIGFSKKGSSKFFILTCLISSEQKAFEKIIQKIYEYRKKYKNIRSHGLHAHKERPETKKKFIKLFNNTQGDCKIVSIVIDKTKFRAVIRNQKEILYNLATNLLLEILIAQGVLNQKEHACVYFSQRETNRFLNENFRSYIRQVMSLQKIKCDLVLAYSHQERGLQAVDFISWFLFRGYEHQDFSYWKLIDKNRVEEKKYP